jgi:hypothetical protein
VFPSYLPLREPFNAVPRIFNDFHPREYSAYDEFPQWFRRVVS